MRALFDTAFGASPALFGSLVGACNKNGISDACTYRA